MPTAQRDSDSQRLSYGLSFVEQLTEVGGEWAVAPLEKAATIGKNEELLDPITNALDRIKARKA